ncbi:MAG: hypothetical protein KZQ83_16365 [gamma proteobacterium symbiont of Taylorina sp.]|nr:hypothetical protein [gamma proteobacterium symbiont of Taylorina sp.]
MIVIIGLFYCQSSLSIGHIRLSIEQLLLNTASDSLEKKSDSTESLDSSAKLYQDLQLDQLELELDISSLPASLNINFSKIKFPEPYSSLKSVKLHCPSFSFENNSFFCEKGNISARGLFPVNSQSKSLLSTALFSLQYNLLNDQLSLTIDHLNTSHSKENGLISIEFQINKNNWSAKLQAQQVNYQEIKHYIDFYLAAEIKKFNELGGQGSFIAQFSGKISQENSFRLKSANINGSFKQLHYSYQEDLAENLEFQYQLNYKAELSSSSAQTKLMPRGYKAELSSSSAQTKLMPRGYQQKLSQNQEIRVLLSKPKGEIYQNGIYVVFQGNELLDAQLSYQKNHNTIAFSKFSLKLPHILELESTGKINLDPDLKDIAKLINLEAKLRLSNSSRLNSLYLNNILEGTDYEDFELDGKLDSTVKLKSINNSQHVDINLNAYNLSLKFKDNISFEHLNAVINWQNSNINKEIKSHLTWEKASLSQLPLGQTSVDFITQGDQFRLLEKTEIPLFDGAIQIDHLDIKHMDQTSEADRKMTLVVDGMIKPISLSLISEHFNWPVMDGKLSAIIPSTTYGKDHFKIGGAMLLQVFDGTIIIKNLTIENPLQDYARLQANIDLNHLNLESLTKTYDFGEIQGRLEGNISNLILQSWQPIAFNASFRTPEKDKSRHRISQTAIDNISSLGGVSGLISRSFLSIFETFGYHKIGLSCRLENNICSMAGVEKKGDGYYIVKGGGIPRIDVMGFQDKVNWQVLISRLTSIRNANQAVIQ